MRRDGGSSLPSVIVSMVIFGICFTAMLQGYARGTAAMWNARVNQEATAVAAWYSAVAQQQGCTSVPADGLVVTELAGRAVLPHEGFTVLCAEGSAMGWPPALTSDGTAGTREVHSFTVTVEWNTHSHASRSYEQTVLQPPTT